MLKQISQFHAQFMMKLENMAGWQQLKAKCKL